MFTSTSQNFKSLNWIIDSGATNHIATSILIKPLFVSFLESSYQMVLVQKSQVLVLHIFHTIYMFMMFFVHLLLMWTFSMPVNLKLPLIIPFIFSPFFVSCRTLLRRGWLAYGSRVRCLTILCHNQSCIHFHQPPIKFLHRQQLLILNEWSIHPSCFLNFCQKQFHLLFMILSNNVMFALWQNKLDYLFL